MITLIVAASTNNVIGKNNQLLWHLPNDMKFFKQTTWAMPVIMGRKTFESIGNKPLNGRINIVITRKTNFQQQGIVVVNSLEDAVFVAHENQYKEVFIIGGGEIYRQAMPQASKIYLTRVHATVEGDTFFEPVDENKFYLKSSTTHYANTKHGHNYSFETWLRK